MRRLKVLALEPYYNLSHACFLEGYAGRSRHAVETWSLAPRKWKWRMRGSAYAFAERARGAAPEGAPDVLLASDYLNLADWRALAPRGFREAPAILYFHENQVTYPLGPQAPKDFHYGWINLSSALAADRILFNSRYHREEFLGTLERILSRMPDHVPAGLAARIRGRSSVFPVAIDFAQHRAARARAARSEGGVPLVLWNHRWEGDKDPELLLSAMLEAKRRGVLFRLAVCGQSFRERPAALERAKVELREELESFGFLEDRDAYLSLVARSDFVLSTARQEFFGVSVVEAMYLGCLPILPRALSYPEILPERLHATFLYDSPERLPDVLCRLLRAPPIHLRSQIEEAAARFDSSRLAPELDAIVEEVYAAGSAFGGAA
ncbi:MAG: tRNA-queuosine alpha-mannosyltransferase domain-containing protein [Planctomycetota bacterium]